ncbi:MAG: 2-dehydro-3-deoxygalactonokinase [Pseudomonadota bacterium]|nr:2-dehydro-3-deoxygalactonokinase [Pseudomonadota bacterium]
MSTENGRWMAVDWSNGRLRVWVMGADGAVLDREEADVTGQTAYETGLAPIIAHHLDDDAAMDILVAGDPAAPGGWGTRDLVSVPCAPPAAGTGARVEARDDRLRVRLVPGVQQKDPPGLMLADAVRIRGFLSLDDTFDGVICLAGPRTRWVHISAGEIVSFQSFVTGDFVSNTLAQIGVTGTPGVAMGDAVSSAISRPESVAARIGALEAGHRLGRTPDQTVCDEVWGLFLGLELAAARPYWLGQRVALVGAGDRKAAYRSAMQAQGVLLEDADEEEAILAGFRAIRS